MPPYHGVPADLWSCGIILVVLLTGGLPWKIASMESNEYVAWKDSKAGHLEPFVELDHLAMDLIQKILVHIPSRRAKLKEIKDHQWCNTCFDRLGKSTRMYAVILVLDCKGGGGLL
ncbi:serine/threonine-protein kinase grp-like [Cryptotermes secundus]|uniref:serine/threonine-protein kinase grp-like n=1 Tax=Cryptotermes secundus TaxID=105785 RepID=UPI000CD7B38B|nr:serine/threonine-protein kinase grp-like [Cryptotermes secundus]